VDPHFLIQATGLLINPDLLPVLPRVPNIGVHWHYNNRNSSPLTVQTIGFLVVFLPFDDKALNILFLLNEGTILAAFAISSIFLNSYTD